MTKDGLGGTSSNSETVDASLVEQQILFWLNITIVRPGIASERYQLEPPEAEAFEPDRSVPGLHMSGRLCQAHTPETLDDSWFRTATSKVILDRLNLFSTQVSSALVIPTQTFFLGPVASTNRPSKLALRFTAAHESRHHQSAVWLEHWDDTTLPGFHCSPNHSRLIVASNFRHYPPASCCANHLPCDSSLNKTRVIENPAKDCASLARLP